MQRVTISLPPKLLMRCAGDARAQQIGLSTYFRRLAEERHGFLKISQPPPQEVHETRRNEDGWVLREMRGPEPAPLPRPLPVAGSGGIGPKPVPRFVPVPEVPMAAREAMTLEDLERQVGVVPPEES